MLHNLNIAVQLHNSPDGVKQHLRATTSEFYQCISETAGDCFTKRSEKIVFGMVMNEFSHLQISVVGKQGSKKLLPVFDLRLRTGFNMADGTLVTTSSTAPDDLGPG